MPKSATLDHPLGIVRASESTPEGTQFTPKQNELLRLTEEGLRARMAAGEIAAVSRVQSQTRGVRPEGNTPYRPGMITVAIYELPLDA